MKAPQGLRGGSKESLRNPRAATAPSHSTNGEVLIRVRDNGEGISAALVPRIFDLFTQADISLTRSRGGLGIGLNLVRALVALHGGAVSVHSEGVGRGRGSEFIVRLPLPSSG